MKPNRLCVRSVDFRAVSDEERAKGDGDGRTLEGYAAVFNEPTEINSWEGTFSEKIARGAFKKTIAERMPVLQFDHGKDARTGSVPIGKFEDIREDRKGLFVAATLFDNPVVEPIRQAIEGGAISGMSFRFKVTRDEWRDKNGNKVRADELGELLWSPGDRGPLERTIREVELFEAGPVVFPAYPQTSVGVRSLTDEERESLIAEYRRTVAEDDEGDEQREEQAPNTDVIDESAEPRNGAVEDSVSESPEDAARFEGTSAGLRSKRLREIRLAQLSKNLER